ncbi:MAG TPA: phospho-N-acetylmuramoyl-pentapeptide-transferase [Myxococcales bacterium]|jgi:phospho-N-acetylmuramoyl-pentapeptide-transferase|nr:phospho-N-acetylmuramoyl-pentapeptide-transferase [Myxococcales bacterium]
MLYNLLYPFADRIAIFNVLRYPSFRILAAGLTSLLIGLLAGPRYIEAIRERQYGASNVREDTPEGHKKKKGTPSMGGGLILWALFLGTILFADLTSRLVWSVLVITMGFGAIGFADDWLKFTKKNSKGLAGRKKLFFQAAIFLAVMLIAFVDWKAGVLHPQLLLDTRITIPFVKVKSFNPQLGWLYLLFAFFVIVGTSNAVNLTDGLDGLAIGPTIVSALTFLLLAYLAGLVIKGFNIADYLLIPHVEGGSELAVFCAAMAGAGISFLWFNTYPATVFMGDVGSLALGGGLGMLAVLTKNEVDSAIIHGVFLAEALSVILQVFWFKRTGKRIFRMAPIHHHFELEGWAEPKIIVRFWIVSIILALVALASLKVR